ncbi:MAG: HAD-IIIA family hydrolase [Methylacidiphilales bacterium]|nr:HAD-IIIA family hydrolase [Candidatus Methylacidiphilales bacterium]
MPRAVFLDRDGVLNAPLIRHGLPYPPQTLEEFHIYPEVPEACALLHEAHFLLVVVTNQPDVGRGTQRLEVIEQMHALLTQMIPVNRIEICTAADDKAPDAERRKPAPGMLFDAARALGLELAHSYMIGDRWRDIDCGLAAGCKTIFIERNYAEKLRQRPHHYAANLLDAARLILSLGQPQNTPLAQAAHLP